MRLNARERTGNQAGALRQKRKIRPLSFAMICTAAA